VDSDREGSAGERAPVGPVRSVTGVVTDVLPHALYRVKLDGEHAGGHMVVAHVADRIDRNFVRVLVGDRVDVELSARDQGRGRIVRKI
jgi:translation initiation factor IF-1